MSTSDIHLDPDQARNEVFSKTEPMTAAPAPPCPVGTTVALESFGTANVLHISSFKSDIAYWLDSARSRVWSRIFQSSGTTGALVSQSPFSSEGLELYRQASLETFWSVLGVYFTDPKKIPGFSLIPDLTEWPQSSLAQMVDWIRSDSGNVTYVSKPWQTQHSPVWVFGTAFHFVQWADRGLKLTLPEGSLVIETGGTKGQSRTVTRHELYRLISESFGVTSNRIISEYGMSELASQAYDFVSKGSEEPVPLEDRYYQFPYWVSLRVLTRGGTLATSGTGSLCILDAKRKDFPWEILTEDFVTLRDHGNFVLHGRVPSSPLKGCSLRVEEIYSEGKHGPVSLENNEPEFIDFPANAERRSHDADAILMSVIESDEHFKLLTECLSSPKFAKWAIEDLQKSILKAQTRWSEIFGPYSQKRLPKRWLLIPSGTHPLGLLQPLYIASILGLDLTIRLTDAAEIINFWAKKFGNIINISLLPREFRIDSKPLPGIDAIQIFGSNETIAKLKQVNSQAIQSFGSLITASVVTQSETLSHRDQIWKDALSLAQRGCLSARLLFVLGEGEHGKLISDLSESENAELKDLADNYAVGLNHSAYRLRREARNVVQYKSGQPLILCHTWSKSSRLEDYLADRPFVLPVVVVTSDVLHEWNSWLRDAPEELGLLSLSPQIMKMNFDFRRRTCPLGEANAPAWDATHQGHRLFEI